MIATTIGVNIFGKVAWLSKGAAKTYNAMRAAGMPSGGITSAGRTYNEQIALFTERYTTNFLASGMRDRRVWQGRAYWRKRGVAAAAVPGTSNHETGNALDLSGTALAWVRKYGHLYGWVIDKVPNEPWHVEYRGPADDTPDPVPTPPTPEQPQRTEYKEIVMSNFIERALEAAYRNETGRSPGREELDPRLVAVALSADPLVALRQQINEIDASQESNRFFVRSLYASLLGRPGSQVDWDFWIDQAGGGDVDTGPKAALIINGIKGSDEYRNRPR